MPLPDSWGAFWDQVEGIKRGLTRNKAVHVNSQGLKDQVRAFGEMWFSGTRNDMQRTGIPTEELLPLDEPIKRLVELATGRNLKRHYQDALRAVRRTRVRLEPRLIIAGAENAAADSLSMSSLESNILRTLDAILPSAGVSYRQVLFDLGQKERFSYRGSATELREAVRELLDHLAPDEEVLQSPGFKLEKDRRAPTMKQKARFILKARELGPTSRRAPEQAVALLEDQIASIARSVYERGSAATHGVTTRSQLLSFKTYADAVLAELLQVHS